MAIPPPDAARLAALNQHYAFGLSEAELAEFGPAVAATLAASESRQRFAGVTGSTRTPAASRWPSTRNGGSPSVIWKPGPASCTPGTSAITSAPPWVRS